MSEYDNNNENQIRDNYLTWLFVYMSIGLVIALVLPFPISVGVLLLVLFLVNMVRTEIALRKAGIGGIKGLYKSYSSLGFRHYRNNQQKHYPFNILG
jgi:hypothetical protein